LSQQGIALWNRTWLKPGATRVARAGTVPMGARWQVGEGRVAAIAYTAEIADAEQIAARVAIAPRDFRFTVSWTAGDRLHITVEGIDRGSYLNGEKIRAEFSAPMALVQPVPQVGPGRYELDVDAPRLPVMVTVRTGTEVLERFAVSGRYAPEFDAIGNDRANLQELADRTGGGVIEAGPTEPIDFHWPAREIPLGARVAGMGAMLIAGGLVVWRRFVGR
jgi:hypothetical protein